MRSMGRRLREASPMRVKGLGGEGICAASRPEIIRMVEPELPSTKTYGYHRAGVWPRW